ncbi:MAG: thiamine pyrophosphate-dependent dehydrogenase E1 component subunit alpha [Planctomycetes bacterium]|nr:thiamine pyrophosphate-dependent dehydrogenase E1 component subunit alpha [Planctomycetota bacterium]
MMQPKEPKLDISPEVLLEIYYCMLLCRRFEERLAALYKQGKILGGIFSGIGQEAVSLGTCFDLLPGDAVFPLHRDIGVVLTRGVDPKVLLAQIMGKTTGMSRGKADYLHGGDPELGIYGSTSMLGSSLPLACGAALAFKLKLTNHVAVAYIGDGGTSRGDFHEAVNFAAVQRLPVIFVVENNQYAYSTPIEKQMAVANVAERSSGYGLPTHSVGGNDILEIRHLMARCVERARHWLGPSLIECQTYRWHGHSEHDDASYRETEEYLEWKSRDPIPRYQAYLREKDLLTDNVAQRYLDQVNAEIDAALEFAEKSPFPEPEEASEGVFADT